MLRVRVYAMCQPFAGDLNHLDKANEPLAWTLASEHNLHFMGTKMAKIRRDILNGDI
jgi:queuine tRNA-ribosyltransferase